MAETTRERSTIRFPYGDLDDAVEVARAIHENYGRTATLDQLAAAMDHTLSGAFRNKVATASTFGVVDTARKEVSLTDLGEEIVDPQTEAAAKAQAFLHVPLYAKAVEAFRGRRLPADSGFESEIVRLGVSPKQASKARQALYRSAEQAGFFSRGKDRLVEPAAGKVMPVLTRQVTDTDAGQFHDGGEQVTTLNHPLIVGLWRMLPDPATRTLTPEEQADWLEAAKVNLRVLYGGLRQGPARAARPPELDDKPS